jgi:hypothetical protein
MSVFQKSDVADLKTPQQWRRLRRQPKADEKPLKNDMYAEWQTEWLRYELTQEGHLPQNSYGNIWVYYGLLPKECMYLDHPKTAQACRKAKVEFVPAVIGFEHTKKGGYPITKGAVIFRRDFEAVKKQTKLIESKT